MAAGWSGNRRGPDIQLHIALWTFPDTSASKHPFSCIFKLTKAPTFV
jgi:hypothetical protein